MVHHCHILINTTTSFITGGTTQNPDKSLSINRKSWISRKNSWEEIPDTANRKCDLASKATALRTQCGLKMWNSWDRSRVYVVEFEAKTIHDEYDRDYKDRAGAAVCTDVLEIDSKKGTLEWLPNVPKPPKQVKANGTLVTFPDRLLQGGYGNETHVYYLGGLDKLNSLLGNAVWRIEDDGEWDETSELLKTPFYSGLVVPVSYKMCHEGKKHDDE